MIPISGQLQFDKEKDVVFREQLTTIRYCTTINEYIIEQVVPWIAWYNRYYLITEEDYNKAKDNFEYLKEKYPEAIGSANTLPRGETFIGSQNLRDYDGREKFTDFFTHAGNPFLGYFYDEKDHVLYAHILMYNNHFAVLPYRIIEVTKKDENGNDVVDYIRPLEDLPDVILIHSTENKDGQSIPLFMAIQVDAKGNIIR